MIQWIGVGLTVVGMVINGYQQFKPLTPQPPVVEYQQQQAGYYQAVFDPVNNKVYVLYPNGQWYEQIPIRADQAQHSSPLGTSQGAQQSPLGQRVAQQPAQTTPNPWLR